METALEHLAPEEQRSDESVLWYERFLRFLNMPKPRSILEVCNQFRDERGAKRSNGVPMSWLQRSTQFEWRGRADRWDLSKLEEEDIQRKKEDELKKKLRMEAIEKQYLREIESANLLHKKAVDVLQLPHVEQIVEQDTEDGKQLVTINPIRSPEFRAATKMFETSSNLARRGLNLPQDTKRVEVNWEQEARQYGIDPEALIEQFTRFLVSTNPRRGTGQNIEWDATATETTDYGSAEGATAEKLLTLPPPSND